MPDLSYESNFNGAVAGIDEAGRGPWAGPVVAAAVILNTQTLPRELITGLDDSKKLTKLKRETLHALLPEHASIGIGIAEPAEIDSINILQATLSAMARALGELDLLPVHALVDGNHAPVLPCPVTCVVKGDSKSLSIAAASIVAKVERDRLMGELSRAHPGYGWERNAGYGTAEHQAALQRLGVTQHHRQSFKPIQKILLQDIGHH
ncbi:MAG: ribonuclease HII [Rhodospirillales bacterium]